MNEPIQKMVIIISDEDRMKLFDDPNYSRIIDILRQGEMTVKEIHGLFNGGYEDKKTLSTIYRYIETLMENGLIFISKERLKRGHLVVRYYSRTAKIFAFQDQRLEQNTVGAILQLSEKIFQVTAEEKETLESLLETVAKELQESEIQFYEEHGDEIFALEKEFGFKAIKMAAKVLNEFLYLGQHPDSLKTIYRILKNR